MFGWTDAEYSAQPAVKNDWFLQFDQLETRLAEKRSEAST